MKKKTRTLFIFCMRNKQQKVIFDKYKRMSVALAEVAAQALETLLQAEETGKTFPSNAGNKKNISNSPHVDHYECEVCKTIYPITDVVLPVRERVANGYVSKTKTKNERGAALGKAKLLTKSTGQKFEPGGDSIYSILVSDEILPPQTETYTDGVLEGRCIRCSNVYYVGKTLMPNNTYRFSDVYGTVNDQEIQYLDDAATRLGLTCVSNLLSPSQKTYTIHRRPLYAGQSAAFDSFQIAYESFILSLAD